MPKYELSESLKIARQKAAELNLPIKIIKGSRENEREITFYFEAENRVDFRILVQELNNFFKESIRLEQIGSRDVVKKIGSFGICGQEVCCKRFLNGFQSITNDMIIAQGLKCSPAACTGMCGKLVCCLSYECPKEKLLAIQKTKKQNKVKLAQKKAEVKPEIKEEMNIPNKKINNELQPIQTPPENPQKVEIQNAPIQVKEEKINRQIEQVPLANLGHKVETINDTKTNEVSLTKVHDTSSSSKKHFKKKKNKPPVTNKKIKTKRSKLVRIVRK